MGMVKVHPSWFDKDQKSLARTEGPLLLRDASKLYYTPGKGYYVGTYSQDRTNFWKGCTEEYNKAMRPKGD